MIKRIGECKMCGRCCTRRYIESGMSEQEKADARANAEKKGDITRLRDQCKHLERRKGGTFICRIGQNRPPHCEAFPDRPEDIFWVGCGYRFIRINVETGEETEIELTERAKNNK